VRFVRGDVSVEDDVIASIVATVDAYGSLTTV